MEDIDNKLKEIYGVTSKWSETGYLLKDGTKLDLSGKNQGGSPNRRSIDHREIFDGWEYEWFDGMIKFMSMGAIRVSPETPGVGIVIEPTSAQYVALRDFIEKVGYDAEYFAVDLSAKNGDTLDSREYEGSFYSSKIINDIKHYFKNGDLSQESELSRFRESKESMVGYRNETAYGSGVRDLRDVIEFEIVELNNIDIPDTLLNSFPIRLNQRKELEYIVDNIEELTDEEKQKAVDTCVDVVKAEYPNAKYCLWLGSKEAVENNYEGNEENIDVYNIEHIKPISDLGFEYDGCLYVYDELPKPIKDI